MPVLVKKPTETQEDKSVTLEPVTDGVGAPVGMSRDEALVIQQIVPEAMCSCTFKMYSEDGAEFMITIRAQHPVTMFDQLETAAQYAQSNLGLAFGRKKTAETHQAQPEKQEQASGKQVLGEGTNRLVSIEVTSKHVEFNVEGFTWPLKDSRGPDVVFALFEKELGFVVEHFKSPAAYRAGVDWDGSIYVDWEKVEKNGSKYWNVKLVHA